jgi:mannitol/fructose-specific phosphotransferase system IIA component
MGFKPNFLLQKSWNFIQKNEKKSKNIIVSFAGGALVMGGMTQFELVKTLEDTDCDQLFLLGNLIHITKKIQQECHIIYTKMGNGMDMKNYTKS